MFSYESIGSAPSPLCLPFAHALAILQAKQRHQVTASRDSMSSALLSACHKDCQIGQSGMTFKMLCVYCRSG